MSKANSRVEAFKYVDRAIRLQLSEDAALSEVEECLNKALKLDPDSVEALQEAAHFYDAVMPNARKARRYAVICREKASKVVGEMEEILAQ
jgi:Tfp pilus assembly protein PilF